MNFCETKSSIKGIDSLYWWFELVCSFNTHTASIWIFIFQSDIRHLPQFNCSTKWLLYIVKCLRQNIKHIVLLLIRSPSCFGCFSLIFLYPDLQGPQQLAYISMTPIWHVRPRILEKDKIKFQTWIPTPKDRYLFIHVRSIGHNELLVLISSCYYCVVH